MDKLQLACDWEKMKQMLLEAEPQLSNDDVDFAEGQDEDLINRLMEKLGRSHEQVVGWVESVSSTTSKAS
ncbi:MAG: hypothetical protein JWR61_4563 [Ferruginibacter sp.]|jgi:hypothetical protein|uniref:hypothetical protein n=1 Tax=Ferruginibacter sp. TaxID=1940288 RepID=UPI002659E252|nr:hypothetical protein [Ferruginibacter sp.]MDB5279608.1 hypothetical protein [Ferruginibacter sp.]